MKNRIVYVVLALFGAGLLAACDGGPGTDLAGYEGQRPLILMKVTQAFTPDIQWVGGRVAAVGVNRGDRAALDSTLVWLMRGDGNTIGSHVTVGQEGRDDLVRQFGGTPLDSLVDGETYTFWLAEEDVFAAGLAGADAFGFADTTLTMGLLLRGTIRGGLDAGLRVVREERLLGTRYIVEWNPAVKFRQVALRKGAGSPGFTGLVWHIAQDPGTPDAIASPLVIGDTVDVAPTAVAWPESGFEPDSYVLWMTDSTWDGSFGLRAPGMAAFTIFATSFE